MEVALSGLGLDPEGIAAEHRREREPEVELRRLVVVVLVLMQACHHAHDAISGVRHHHAQRWRALEEHLAAAHRGGDNLADKVLIDLVKRCVRCERLVAITVRANSERSPGAVPVGVPHGLQGVYPVPAFVHVPSRNFVYSAQVL